MRAVILGLRDAEGRRRAEAESAALLTTVAHELRSPLTGVKGFSSTLLRNWDRFTDDQKRLMLETIEADADRVTRLITELLDASRINVGRLTVHAQPLDLRPRLEAQVERRVAAGADREQFVVDVPDDLPQLWADPDRLEQIVANLVENAVRHGQGTVRLAAERAALGDRPAVDLLVADDGEGIATQHRELVFSRFWQGGAKHGTGLGLYLVRGLVEAHGGVVRVEDAPGGGAQMRGDVPRRRGLTPLPACPRGDTRTPLARSGQRPNGIRGTRLSEWGPCLPSRSRRTGAPCRAGRSGPHWCSAPWCAPRCSRAGCC